MSPGEDCAQTAYAKTYHLKPESAFKKFYLDFKSDQFNLNADTNYSIVVSSGMPIISKIKKSQ